jgi:sugar phosphate isomerase/epimerase
MKIGCCIGIECYDAVLAAGYDNITLAAKDIAAMEEAAFGEVLAKVKNGPLVLSSLNSFSPPEVKLSGGGYSAEALTIYAVPLFDRAAALGVRHIGIGAPFSRNMPDGFSKQLALEQLRQSLGLLCDLGAPLGIDILLEAVCDIECNLIVTTDEALEVVRSMGVQNLHLVYDIYHAHMMNEPVSNIGLAGGEIKVVHISQDEGRGRRLYLDPDKTNEYLPYIRALQEIGYDGEISLEAFFGDPAVELPRSYDILKKCLTGDRD